MIDLIQKALEAKRESKPIEFKEYFDPTSNSDWCEIIKDIVAIANSGGGVILIGVDNAGKPCDTLPDAISHIDPADISNKIYKYTGSTDLTFEISEVKKEERNILAFAIQPATIPIVFIKPGTYDVGSGKQHSAFSVGTIYFRHGAKSEPGTTEDIRKVIEWRLETIRKTWIKGLRKVVQAPQGSQILTVLPSGRIDGSIRAVKDPKATPVFLTRDRKRSSGLLVHEEISEGIFEEINNVLDANNALSKGQQKFYLGEPVYYRIYAERQYVVPNDANIALLLDSAVFNFYSPALFWVLQLPINIVAKIYSGLFFQPKSPNIHHLLRMSILIGKTFSEWIYNKWHEKWKDHPQPPSFYYTFKRMLSYLDEEVDFRIIAARTTINGQFSIEGEVPISNMKLIENPDKASILLSSLCNRIFNGENSLRTIARQLDCLAYGLEINKQSPEISREIMNKIGDQEAGDLAITEDEN
ncbi:MAG: ATP-binding protein [Patescibacteria group bacterium]|nr:ATP-binding protein [Patescibacteria group bacterium]